MIRSWNGFKVSTLDLEACRFMTTSHQNHAYCLLNVPNHVTGASAATPLWQVQLSGQAKKAFNYKAAAVVRNALLQHPNTAVRSLQDLETTRRALAKWPRWPRWCGRSGGVAGGAVCWWGHSLRSARLHCVHTELASCPCLGVVMVQGQPPERGLLASPERTWQDHEEATARLKAIRQRDAERKRGQRTRVRAMRQADAEGHVAEVQNEQRTRGDFFFAFECFLFEREREAIATSWFSWRSRRPWRRTLPKKKWCQSTSSPFMGASFTSARSLMIKRCQVPIFKLGHRNISASMCSSLSLAMPRPASSKSRVSWRASWTTCRSTSWTWLRLRTLRQPGWQPRRLWSRVRTKRTLSEGAEWKHWPGVQKRVHKNGLSMYYWTELYMRSACIVKGTICWIHEPCRTGHDRRMPTLRHAPIRLVQKTRMGWACLVFHQSHWCLQSRWATLTLGHSLTSDNERHQNHEMKNSNTKEKRIKIFLSSRICVVIASLPCFLWTKLYAVPWSRMQCFFSDCPQCSSDGRVVTFGYSCRFPCVDMSVFPHLPVICFAFACLLGWVGDMLMLETVQ